MVINSKTGSLIALTVTIVLASTTTSVSEGAKTNNELKNSFADWFQETAKEANFLDTVEATRRMSIFEETDIKNFPSSVSGLFAVEETKSNRLSPGEQRWFNVYSDFVVEDCVLFVDTTWITKSSDIRWKYFTVAEITLAKVNRVYASERGTPITFQMKSGSPGSYTAKLSVRDIIRHGDIYGIQRVSENGDVKWSPLVADTHNHQMGSSWTVRDATPSQFRFSFPYLANDSVDAFVSNLRGIIEHCQN